MTDSRPDTPRNRGDHDAPHVSPVTPAEDARSVLLNRVSWGAVLAGVVVALVAQLILNMIGIGIGAATLDPAGAADQNPSARGFSIGAAVWWTVSGILAALAGGVSAVGAVGTAEQFSGEGRVTGLALGATMATAVNPYGDGQAANRVVAAIDQWFGIGQRMPDFVASQDRTA